MKQEIENIEKIRTKNERLFEEFHIDGAEGHNKSLNWLLETSESIGAEIDMEPGEHRYDSMGFDIRLRGRFSGVKYGIKVSYKPSFGRIISRRIGQLDEQIKASHSVDEDAILWPAMMYPFDKMIETDTRWYDHRRGDWERVCVEPSRLSHEPWVWPFDNIVSLMYALYEDLETAMLPHMNTLRKAVLASYPLSWFMGETDPRLPVEEVSSYINYLVDIDCARCEEDLEGLNANYEQEISMLREAHEARERTFDSMMLQVLGEE